MVVNFIFLSSENTTKNNLFVEGNVGIETTSPDAKLHTNGTVLVGTKTPGNRINPSATGEDSDLYVSNNRNY